MAEKYVYAFGPFQCKAGDYCLTYGSKNVDLSPRLYETLLALLRAGGRVIRKDDLVRAVWPDQFVTDASLTKAISELRSTLASFDGNNYIRTVTGIGYRFCRDVEVLLTAGDPVNKTEVARSQMPTEAEITGSPVELADYAFEAYSKAEYFWRRRNVKGIQQALYFAEKATTFDPAFALAFVRIANCYGALITQGEGVPMELLVKAKTAADRALALDPNLPDAYITMGNLSVRYELDWHAAEANYLSAITRSPDSAVGYHWYGNALVAAGRIEQGIEILEKAFILQPSSLSIRIARAQAHFLAGNYGVGQRQLEDILELNPAFSGAYFGLGMVLGALDKASEAMKMFRRAVQVSGRKSFYLSNLAYAHSRWGKQVHARKILLELEQLATKRYVSSYDLAVVHASLGHEKEAVALLRQAVERRDAMVMWLGVDPRLAGLRSSGALQPLLDRFRLLLDRFRLMSAAKRAAAAV
jgi:DNA-binding winged helix-turn-helix (wHTH) protein/Flp pilus assembly protein TadD